jgi:hypothetical protein
MALLHSGNRPSANMVGKVFLINTEKPLLVNFVILTVPTQFSINIVHAGQAGIKRGDCFLWTGSQKVKKDWNNGEQNDGEGEI